MNPLALLLALILLASAGLFFIATRLAGQHRALSSRSFSSITQRVNVVYAWVICFLLCGLGIGPYMGLFSPHGSPQLTPVQQHSIVHEGYYAAPGSEMRFTSDTQDETFQHGALDEGEFLSLRPNTTVGHPSIDRWFVKYDLRSQPLRFDGRCVNLPESWWLSPGDTLFVFRTTQDSTYFMALRWVTDTNWLGNPTNAFIYSDGVRLGDSLAYRHRDVLLTRRIYREARNLGVMFRLAPTSFKDEINTNELDPAWWDVLRGITLIRQSKNVTDPDSSLMGVLVADSLFQDSPHASPSLNVELYKNADRLERMPVLEDSIEVKPGTGISYGYGFRNALVLAPLADSLYKDDRLDYIARLDFRLAPSWNLPPDPDTTFIITSSTAFIPLDGYVFNTVGERHPFYAKARLNAARDALEVNDGKESRAFALNAAIALGDASQGVVLALRPRRVPTPRVPFLGIALPSGIGVGLWAIFFLIGLTAFFHLIVGTERHERVKLDLAWTLIWGLTLTLLTVRLLLSYRLALLPPANATPDEVANVFNKSFLVSFWALLLLPGLLLTMRVPFYSGRQRSQRWRRFKNNVRAWKIWTTQFVPKTNALKARLAASLNKHESVTISVASLLLLVVLGVLVKVTFELNIWVVLMVIAVAWLALVKFVPFPMLRDFSNAFGRQWPLLLPLVWIGLGMAFGSNEALGPVRINIGTHILIILGIVLSLARIMPEPTTADKVVMSLLVVGAVGGCMMGIGDRGFIIYSLSLGFFLVLLWLWNYQPARRRPRRKQRWLKLWTMIKNPQILLLALPVVIPLLLFTVPRALPETLVGPRGNVYYRIVSVTDTEEDVLMNRGEVNNINIDMLLRNSHQHWQMLLYAAEGALASGGKGYGQAPLSDAGMTYPTSITDGAFSMYLLSENGMWVAFLYLLLHVGLCAACIYGGWFMERTYQYRGVALFAIGAFFACNALYMASANLGTIFFTGQNIPLLGLYSWSDVMQTAFLLCCATVLLLKGMKSGAVDTAQRAMRDHIPLLRFGQVFLGVAVIIPMLLLYHMATFNPEHRENHDFNRALFEEVGKRTWTYNEDTNELEISGFEELAEIENLYKTQFESRANKFDENGGLYYLVPVTDPEPGQPKAEVRLNRFYFRLRSPFRSRVRWRGMVYARSDDTEPTMSALGRQFRVRLSSDPNYQSVNLFTWDPVDASGGVVFLDQRNNPIVDFERRGNELYLTPLGDTWSVFHEGQPLRAEKQLKPLDIIVLEHRTSAGNRQNLIYLGTPPPVLGAAMWRNGKLQHVYPEGDVFPAVYTIMKAGDHALALAAQDERPEQEAALRDTTGLPLSLYIPLHRRLQETLETYARHTPPFQRNEPLNTNILALTVMDAFSGEVLALPAWPVPDPNADDFEDRVLAATPVQQRRLLRNHNLVRHVIGSTTKPILFTTIAAQLWPDSTGQGYDVAQITYFNRKTRRDVPLARNQDLPSHPHWGLAGIPLEQWWDCDASESPIDARVFLVRSRNYYVAMTGMLGMLIHPTDLDRVLQPGGSSPDLTYKGRPYRLNLNNRSIDSPFTLTDIAEGAAPRINKKITHTLLFRGLPELFNVYVSSDDSLVSPTVIDRMALTRMAAQYLPLLSGEDATRNLYLDDAIPEPIIMKPRDWGARVRADLVSFFLGGGINRWNNVMMAEVGARLATGKKVEATLQQRPDTVNVDSLFADLPAPMNIRDWRNAHIIDPMVGAGQSGTALVITQRLSSAASGYRIMFKTGTLQEGGQNDRRSELLLIVIGQWNAAEESFVPGKTLSAFLYMQKSRTKDGAWKRNDLAPRLIRDLIEYLNEDKANS